MLGQVDLDYNNTSCGLFLTKAVFTRRRIRKVTSVRGQHICFTPLMISVLPTDVEVVMAWSV